MPAAGIVIGLGWVAFWIYWLAASVGVKTGQTRWARFAGVRVAIILVVLLLLRLRIVKGRQAVTHDPWLQITGLVIFLLGLALAVWARKSRPELGNADVRESRPGTGDNWPI